MEPQDVSKWTLPIAPNLYPVSVVFKHEAYTSEALNCACVLELGCYE